MDELAPRDEVSRAIYERLPRPGALGRARHAGVDPGHFPNVFSALREAGLDPKRELVPVAPAAHYMMGGIVADLDARSSVPGLYAVGEASCTGLHGANRLASNSLSECFVFAARAVDAALRGRSRAAASPEPGEAEALRELPAPPAADREIRRALWQGAGIVRDAEGLEGLLAIEHPLVRGIARCALERTSPGARSCAPTTPSGTPRWTGATWSWRARESWAGRPGTERSQGASARGRLARASDGPRLPLLFAPGRVSGRERSLANGSLIYLAGVLLNHGSR